MSGWFPVRAAFLEDAVGEHCLWPPDPGHVPSAMVGLCVAVPVDT